MKDHHTWRANWYRSEVHDIEEYDALQRRHAWAAFYGTLTAVSCAAALLYLFG